MEANERQDPSAGGHLSPQRILEMGWGFAPPMILEAAVQNRVFDALDSGPKTLAETSSATGASERGLRALMDALVGLKLLDRNGDGYALTPESSAFLVSSKPGFQGGFFRHIGRQLISGWMNLSEIVRTGKPAHAVNTEATGAEFFRNFVEDLFPMNYAAAQVLAEDVARARPAGPTKVLDIAAGSGVWGIAAAQRMPTARLTVVDWPVVTPVTRKVAQRHGVADRLSVIEGDLLSVDYGTGYDLAILGHILHSEGEARTKELLNKVFAALAPGGIVAIAEFVADEARTGPPVQPLIFSVNMLTATEEGRTFTFGEMTQWLQDAGFERVRQLPVPAVSPLLLAQKPLA